MATSEGEKQTCWYVMRIFATSDLNELVSHNYVTTFMKIKGSPLPDVIS